ncbi:hypothetical protein [Nioella sp.]|uniref:hypothetical protein n=1 Tax=Nioella sp. TaxID=1912091 RepID=UPI003B5183FC
MFVLFLLSTAFLVFNGGMAQAQTASALSLEEMALADCAGRALAVEQAMQEGASPTEHQTAVARADGLLQVAINRYVVISRVEAFRRRAALALAAENMRMELATQITGAADRAIDRAESNLEEACQHYLD